MYNRQSTVSPLSASEPVSATKSSRTIVVGAGIGGLACAIRLAAAGMQVTVLERQIQPGGKIRSCDRNDIDMDVGPTVMTMPWVFADLFRHAGLELEQALRLTPLQTLAHHRWSDGSSLDLHADKQQSIAAITELAGARAGHEYSDFMHRAQLLYELLEPAFMTREQAGLPGLLWHGGWRSWPTLSKLSPFRSLWSALGASFSDTRLRQLFSRYATYCGSSPMLAPSTLMLIAHVENAGVWRIEGGMRALAAALATCAESLGVEIRCSQEVDNIELRHGTVASLSTLQGETLPAQRIIINADTNAIANGLFGKAVRHAVRPTAANKRSLSAMTFAGTSKIDTKQLNYHNVFFSDDYVQEFAEISRDRKVPTQPTTYVCAPDFDTAGKQRLFVLVNAPANNASKQYDAATIEYDRQNTVAQLRRCGLSLDLDDFEVTTPDHFADRYPGTGGALYGPAMHGWRAAFQRPGNRSRIPGLYLAGGSVHPGSGVPMAALSGRLCAERVLAESEDAR